MEMLNVQTSPTLILKSSLLMGLMKGTKVPFMKTHYKGTNKQFIHVQATLYISCLVDFVVQFCDIKT